MLNLTVFNRTDYLHKMDLALNNLQRLICHKTKQTKPNIILTNLYLWGKLYHNESDTELYMIL